MNSGQPIPSGTPGGGWQWLALSWGFAEATFFFIVPDVFTSRLVLVRPRQGFAACLYSLGGAMVGGILLYFLGQDPKAADAIRSAVGWLPGINQELIEASRLGLEHYGVTALFIGVLSGIPYKLYAMHAAGAGLGAGVFIVSSVCARLIRFLLVTFMAWLLGTKLLPNLNTRAKLRIHAGAWLVFYIFYFWRMGV